MELKEMSAHIDLLSSKTIESTIGVSQEIDSGGISCIPHCILLLFINLEYYTGLI